MSLADELTKLAQLRDQGILSEEEFNSEKAKLLSEQPLDSAQEPSTEGSKERNKTKSKMPMSLRILLVVGALGLGMWGISSGTSKITNQNGSATNSLACDSRVTRNALQNAIESNASSNMLTLQLLDIQNIEDVHTAEDGTVFCNATFVLNSGAERAGYKISRASNGRDTLVEIGPEPYVAPQTAGSSASEPRIIDDNALQAAEIYVSGIFDGGNCCEAILHSSPIATDSIDCGSNYYRPRSFEVRISGRESSSIETVGMCIPKDAATMGDVEIITNLGGTQDRRSLSELEAQ